jgi:hypothetical protein
MPGIWSAGLRNRTEKHNTVSVTGGIRTASLQNTARANLLVHRTLYSSMQEWRGRGEISCFLTRQGGIKKKNI